MRFLLVIYILIFTIINSLTAQDTKKYLVDGNNGTVKIVDEIIFYGSSFYDSNKVNLTIINNSEKSVFFYSGMLKPWSLSQPYTHEIDTIKKEFIVSLVPTFGNFNMINQVDGFVLTTHQNWYEFIEVGPNEIFNVEISHHFYTFEKSGLEYYAIESRNPYDYDKILESSFFDNKKFMDKNYKLSVRLAMYQNIDFVLVPEKRLELYERRDEFKVVDIPISYTPR